jgi:hypothetical protein
MKHLAACLALVLLLAACAPSQGAVQTAIAQTQAAMPSATPSPSATSSPTATFTATITLTPTITSSPTMTFTPTNSPTPIALIKFRPLTYVAGLRKSPNSYVGSLIKTLAHRVDSAGQTTTSSAGNTYWLAPSDMTPRGLNALIVPDLAADNTVSEMQTQEWFWVYGMVQETNGDLPILSAFHIDVIPPDQLPRGDGVYIVNTEIAPGRWKSLSDAKETQSCYWGRMRADGSLRDSYTGYGGASVYIRATDNAVEFRDCGTFVYMGP